MSKADNRVKRDSFIEFKSHAGNKVVNPAQWSVEDEGNEFTLTSPDQQAFITFYTFTVAGTGTMAEFQHQMTVLLEGDWEDSNWSDIEICGIAARRKYLVPKDRNKGSWRVYVLQNGKYYHCARIHALSSVMTLNGTFYESIVKTFEGI